MASDCERIGDWMQTYPSGRQFWPLDPRPEEIDIADIAHALSNLCRFGGHCSRMYSVAEHSVRVSQCQEAGIFTSQDALWGLLHDASEAYLMDLIRPLKVSLRKAGVTLYDIAEERLMLAVCRRFGLPWPQPACVALADGMLLMTEKRDLLRPEPAPWRESQGGGLIQPLSERISPWSSLRARSEFLDRYEELRGDHV